MGAINFDADEIKHSKLVQEEAEMVESEWEPCVTMTRRKNCKRLENGTTSYAEPGIRLVLIGVNMNRPLMEEKLREALLTKTETEELGGEEGWKNLKDPFFNGECAQTFFEVQIHEDDEMEACETTK